MHAQDVVIIGGGCAGLWLAYELAGRRVPCTVVDVAPFAAYASTRNQGWLQSGALYAASGEIPTAEICQRGYQLIAKFAPHAVLTHIPCYYLFEDDHQLEETIRSCKSHRLDIPIEPVELPAIEEPILRDTPLRRAALVQDCPVDTHQLLQILAERAGRNGAHFQTVLSLDEIRFESRGGGWRVHFGDGTGLDCGILVLACGAYIPAMLARLIPGQVPAFDLYKITALVMHGNIASSMLITPCVNRGPSLVPFRGADGVGASVCLFRGHPPLTNVADHEVPEAYLAIHAQKLSDWYTGIRGMVSQGSQITAHFYVCQTLELATTSPSAHPDRTHVLLSHAPHSDLPDNIVTFYPRKFTAAPLVAQECADKVQDLLGPSQASMQSSIVAEDLPPLAKQRYYDQPTHKLVLRGDDLVFEELP